MIYRSSWMTEELDVFRDQFRKFLARDLAPHAERWRLQKMVDRSAWTALGAMGALLPSVPEAYGGLGASFAYDAAVFEDIESIVPEALGGVSVSSGIVAHYILNYGSEQQKRRWLPGMARGELIGAIAMTEPGTGSDLQAVRTTAKLVNDGDGDHYVINGAKTFITNGQNANHVIVVCRTGAEGGAKNISLVMVETDRPGFRRGRQLEKVGMHAQDTSELFFDDLRVPVDHLIGSKEGQGFFQLMEQLPQERLIIAVSGIGAMERALEETLRYTKERKAFGKTVWDFQNTRFKLAEVQAVVLAARAFVDACMVAHLKGELDAARAALAKCWVSEQQCKVMDECLQLFGGYGYMMEYPIAELYVDARVQRIYGGTNEIMKELASRFM